MAIMGNLLQLRPFCNENTRRLVLSFWYFKIIKTKNHGFTMVIPTWFYHPHCTVSYPKMHNTSDESQNKSIFLTFLPQEATELTPISISLVALRLALCAKNFWFGEKFFRKKALENPSAKKKGGAVFCL